MITYRIVCVKTEHPHRHILSVGTGRNVAKPSDTFTVEQVRDKLDADDIFYTSDSKGNVALVYNDNCNAKVIVNGKETDCPVLTIRSRVNAVKANNLDNLAICP